MKIIFKNRHLEKVTIVVNAMTSAVVAGSFAALFGFDEPLLPLEILYFLQGSLLTVFIGEKIVRFFNAVNKREYLWANWFEAPFLLALAIALAGAGRLFAADEPSAVRHFAVGIYLVLQVVSKLCRTSVSIAATGRNPTKALIVSFMVLIIGGAGILMLPRSSRGESLSAVDALFTATSAACVTGLTVKDTGRDFTLMGQWVILSLIQLGGLGIVVFGAVFALLLGQALSVRESAAMQDLLSEQTIGRIGRMIVFIFTVTIVVEAVGAVLMAGMWDDPAVGDMSYQQRWFCSVFHSISAFCNAGFSLFTDNLVSYRKHWAVYGVFCPLIIFGGLGFGVVYDLTNIAADRVTRFLRKCIREKYVFSIKAPKRMRLQSKIVLSTSALLIIAGMAAIMLFERYTAVGVPGTDGSIGDAFFQSVTARTAGFNTIDIAAMSEASRLVLIFLMFIGGSPGGTAGGIKTVTFAVLILTAVSGLLKKRDVEVFKRSISNTIVIRAITVTLLFVMVLFILTLALNVTEHAKGFGLDKLAFEATSALGTVGLSTGITPFLTNAGKVIIILLMLIGRLGPLTLLAVLTFNLRPARYNYANEAIIVG